jgi:hypothetical protein
MIDDDAIHYTIISIIHLLQLQAPESRRAEASATFNWDHAHEQQWALPLCPFFHQHYCLAKLLPHSTFHTPHSMESSNNKCTLCLERMIKTTFSRHFLLEAGDSVLKQSSH